MFGLAPHLLRPANPYSTRRSGGSLRNTAADSTCPVYLPDICHSYRVRLQTLAVAGSPFSLAGPVGHRRPDNAAVQEWGCLRRQPGHGLQGGPVHARVCGRRGEILGDGPENSMYMGRLRRLVSTVGGDPPLLTGRWNLEAPLKTIELSAVSFRHPGADRLALGGVNLTLRRGRERCLVGLNGAGKTTLAKLLLGLYPPPQ